MAFVLRSQRRNFQPQAGHVAGRSPVRNNHCYQRTAEQKRQQRQAKSQPRLNQQLTEAEAHFGGDYFDAAVSWSKTVFNWATSSLVSLRYCVFVPSNSRVLRLYTTRTEYWSAV